MELHVGDRQAVALEIDEERALFEITQNRAAVSALKKLLAERERYHTIQARNYLNEEPRDLHHKAKTNYLAHKHAAMAQAYGALWPFVEKAAGR